MNNLTESFQSHFGRPAGVFSAAPGRLEILGNHTDYNQGFVLSCAVEQKTSFAVAKAEGKVCRIINCKFTGQTEFSLDELDSPVAGEWLNYLKGVYYELRKRGIEPGAVDVVMDSSVPLSAGMSSSAALEVGFCFALKQLYGIELEKTDWARVGQGVENDYLGVSTGLLDQFSSIYGQQDSLIMSDFRTDEVIKNVPVPHGYVFIVANSMEKHDLVDSEYNVRRRDCESAAARLGRVYTGVKALRDVSMQQLEQAKAELTRLEYLRAKHIIGENERVIAGDKLLAAGDVEGFGRLLFESHESSRVNFENSTQRLDYLIELAKSIPGCIGARLSGGGFGGISIHLVREDAAEEYSSRLGAAFKSQTGEQPQIIKCGIGGGAQAVDL
ncbi:galactokinase [Lentisphaerota bacterium ZTH]|nr:galactokinase [Lentisphaerota bacterium]WET06279.1 galactokinase [Lentisphaerota bacterium ZTH]